MGSTKKFWTGVMVGAVAGGILSLLDRETRQAVGGKYNKIAKSITYGVTHPKEVALNIREKTNELRITANQMTEDISYIIDKIEEVRQLTPEVTELVKDTKEAFIKERDGDSEHI